MMNLVAGFANLPNIKIYLYSDGRSFGPTTSKNS